MGPGRYIHPLVEMFSINFIQLMDSKILVSEISGSMHSSHGIKSIIVKKEQNFPMESIPQLVMSEISIAGNRSIMKT